MKQTISTKDLENRLSMFTGTENYYKYSFVSTCYYYSDGVHFLVEEASCYWLLDVILSFQFKLGYQEFQVWEITRLQEAEFMVRAFDGNKCQLTEYYIPFSDFPLDKLTLRYSNKVIYLPTEH